jgi:hypothetical protein
MIMWDDDCHDLSLGPSQEEEYTNRFFEESCRIADQQFRCPILGWGGGSNWNTA